ncbi:MULTISPECIES: magnesium/cobalt transporter CorA [Spirulina sp. CCY15215]|uniref:magnesium/cobalt transporter CorA n=1 Tax=Spirulina sp. CCY15215 TaxID=2767591 RepID=UPI00194DAF26
MTRSPKQENQQDDPILEEEEDYFDYYFDRPGSEPGTLNIDPDALPTQIVLIDYNSDRATRRTDISPQECIPYLDTESVSWFDVQGLGTENILQQVGQICQLHPLVLEDVVNVPQRPKMEDYKEQLLIIVQMVLPNPGKEGFFNEQVGFVLGQHYLITFQEEPTRDCFEPVRSRIRSNTGKVCQLGADYLAYLLLDAVIDNFFPVLEDYGERIDILEDEVLKNPQRAILEDIYDVRRELLALRRAIWPLRSTINALIREDTSLISPEVQVYFRDCYDHIIQLLDIVETYRELSSSLMDVYMSAVNNKVNEVVNLLTIISTIFIPLTFIVGVYGMNFKVMPELDWKWGYATIWGIMILIAIALIIFFWRRGWFDGFYFIRKEKKR